MFKNIKGKTLKVILLVTLISVLIIAAVSMFSMLSLRSNALSSANNLGNAAAYNSETALQEQARNEIQTVAEDSAALVDEKLIAIQNHTVMVADVATQIYSNPADYKPRSIDYLQKGEENTPVAHIRTAPDISFPGVKSEIELAANVQDILKQIVTLNSSIGASYIGSESGFFITVDKNAAGPNNTSYDPTSRGWYKGAKEKNGVFWTDMFADSAGRGASISCAMPFYDKNSGELKGVAGSGALLTDVSEIINSTKVGDTGYAFLLDDKGSVVISPKHQDIITDENGAIIGESYIDSKDENVHNLAEAMLAGKKDVMLLELDGNEVYVAYAPLETVPWSIGLVINVDEVIAPASAMNKQILGITENSSNTLNSNIFIAFIILIIVFILTCAAAVIMANRFSNKIADPIRRLNYSVKSISGGNLDNKISISTGDEIEELADSFNSMTSELQTYMTNLTKVTADKERIATELDVATKIQASMLPCIFPAFPEREEFDIFARMQPAKEVGGDFYDFFLINESTLCTVMADVSGKGVPAALFMVIAKTLIKNNAQAGMSPKAVFEVVNDLLCENNEAGMFVTAFMGYLDIPTGKFTYVNAGHNPPIVRYKGGDYEWLNTKVGFVLAGMEEMVYTQEETRFESGDILYLYTDGVTEAVNPNYELYSDPRLLELANNRLKDKTPESFIYEVKQDIDKFADGAEQADDITMLLLEYKGD